MIGGRHFLLIISKRCILELPSIARVINRSSKGKKTMDREHVKGAAEKAKGAIKGTAGTSRR